VWGELAAVEAIKIQKELKIYSSEIVLLKDKMKLNVGKDYECDVMEVIKI
jgi:hypothetical protein